jgi:hypothetical protein
MLVLDAEWFVLVSFLLAKVFLGAWYRVPIQFSARSYLKKKDCCIKVTLLKFCQNSASSNIIPRFLPQALQLLFAIVKSKSSTLFFKAQPPFFL